MMKLNECLIKILKAKVFYIGMPLKIPNSSYCFIFLLSAKQYIFEVFLLLFLLCPSICGLQLCMILLKVEGFCHPDMDER